MTKALMAIEADRQDVLGLPIDVEMLARLRAAAKLLATHYSTRIEGNRLTAAQVTEVLQGSHFPGRERDETEVRHYYRALDWVERHVETAKRISEEDVRRLHGLVLGGKAKASTYRDGQNVISDTSTRAIVYMPPEAKDVPGLMAELIAWLDRELASGEWPVPVIAGIAHYQFATIHPYYDGNGRTARLLATLVLHRHGYGLKGIYALEEYYAQELQAYYDALAIGPSHNYYMGRAEADLSPFLDYFLAGMAEAFARVRQRASEAAGRGAGDRSERLRQLDPRQRQVLQLFRKRPFLSIAEVAAQLGLSPRTVRPMVRPWLESGFLELADPSRRNRRYRLGRAWIDLLDVKRL